MQPLSKIKTPGPDTCIQLGVCWSASILLSTIQLFRPGKPGDSVLSQWPVVRALPSDTLFLIISKKGKQKGKEEEEEVEVEKVEEDGEEKEKSS